MSAIVYDVVSNREQPWGVYYRVNWSCVGAVDIAEARAFAQALIDVCNAAEARLAQGLQKREPLPAREGG